MKVFFRADGNSRIGWGHVMRSISIACAYSGNGDECFFVCADDSMAEIIHSYGFELYNLNSDYKSMDKELPAFFEIINREKPGLIFFDSYFVDYDYLEKFQHLCKTAYIDDLYSLPYPVSYLINYNIYASEERYINLYKNYKIPHMLLNIKYAPLRKEFQGIIRGYSESIKHVFVSVGGSDEFGLALKFIKCLEKENEFVGSRSFHFILGNFEPDREEIIQLSNKYEWICIHEKVKNMSDLMCKCDIAISAAGSTLYELCACKVPTVSYVMVDNQIDVARGFLDNELILYAGDIRDNSYSVDNIINCFNKLCNDGKKRHKLFNRMRDYVDGRGAERIVDALTIEH